MDELKPCPYRVHGERKASWTIDGEYYYNETFMPCMRSGCPCYHDDNIDAWCDRGGEYIMLGKSPSRQLQENFEAHRKQKAGDHDGHT